MAAFVWLIVNLTDGTVKGTNDTEALGNSGLLKNDEILIIHRNTCDIVDCDTGEANIMMEEYQFPDPHLGAEEDEDGLEKEDDEGDDIPGTADDRGCDIPGSA